MNPKCARARAAKPPAVKPTADGPLNTAKAPSFSFSRFFLVVVVVLVVIAALLP
ncbi:MAG: hypothetical protein ACRD6B_03800 [Bryobacteraceae bacterium]